MAEETQKDETVESSEDKSEETKTDAEESSEKKAEETQQEASDTKKDESEKDKSEKTSIDYKAEVENEREKREKAEKALAERRYKERRKKEKEEEDTEEEDEDEANKPLTREELESSLAKQREQIHKETRQIDAEKIADSLAGSEDEKALILEKWKGLTFPEYSTLKEQLEDCYALANKKKLVSERNEALRALAGKKSANKDASGSHQEESKSSAPALEAGDKQVLQETGFKYNSSTRRYEKKLGSGKVLVRDSKTGEIAPAE